MASPNTNLRVRISADLAQFQQGLGTLRRSVSGLGGVLAGALAGLSVGAVVGGIVRATMESEQAMAQLEARLKSTKGAAGLTKDELVDMAGALQGVSTYGDEAIMGAQSMLLTFTKIGRDVFPQATEAVLNMATAMGTDLNSASVQIGKALNDPIKGVSALGRAGVQFTQGQKDMIERLVETGRTMDAQKIILRELETQFGGAARAARDTMGGAFTALKEAAGDLLEGDTGSDGVRGVKSTIEQLTKLLQDPRTKEAFASMANGVFQLANAFVTLATQAQSAWTAAQRWLTFKLGGTKQIDDLQQIRYEIGEVTKNVEALQGKSSGRGGWMFEPALRKAEDRLRELKSLEEMSTLIFGDGPAKPGVVETGRTSKAGKGRWANINGDPTTNVAADEAADKSKKKLEELRRAQERLRREAERAEEARKAELEAQRSRIESGIRDVEIALARATGREADAAWMEIDDRFKQLIADLKATGNKEGEELVNRLIDIEKADARMAEFKRRFEQALDGFGQPDQAAPVVGQEPGQQLVDEAALEAARQRSLTTLRALRDAALTYANTLSGPAKEAALASIRDMDQALGGLKKSFGETTIAAADMAIAGVADFFYDWASGAKSFKNALGDAVDSFVKGMLRMTTEAAALVLVLKGFDLFMPGFSQFFMQLKGGSAISRHGGGLVTGSGGMRHNLNPLLFGNAPRYHSGGFAGLRPNEVAAVLEKGEEVLTEDDPRHAKNGGKGRGGNVFVNVQNNSSTPAQVNERMSGGDRIIDVVIGAVASDIGRNGAVGKAIGQRFGVQPVGALRG